MAIYGSLGDIDVGAIDKSIADTAVDVFVYDTRKDSDGGAWRKRTQHTSWYNETLNTATRGARREFPAVAVIVAETSKVTIYDGDDPDMPMWMVFNSTGPSYLIESGVRSITAKNAKLASGCVYDLYVIDFISEKQFEYLNSVTLTSSYNIANRNSIPYKSTVYQSYGIIDRSVNDVAMTVLPNAPIDPATGLPIPTIAVATDGGVSVIKDDGTVVDMTGFAPTQKIQIDKNYVISTARTVETDFIFKAPIPSTDSQYDSGFSNTYGGGFYANSGWTTTKPKLRNDGTSGLVFTPDDTIIMGGSSGVELIGKEITVSVTESESPIAYISSSYNTGWMHGDIKGAFLSDTDATNISSSNFVTNGDFSSGTSNWNVPFGVGDTNSFTTNGSGQAVWTVTAGSYWLDQQVYLTPGKTYSISAELISSTNNIWIRIGSGPGGTSEIFDKMTWVSNTEYQFTVPSTWTNNIYLQFGIQATGTLTFDNVVLKEREPDYSVNNNGLQVFGTITKTPVA